MKIDAIIYDFDGVICDSVNIKTEAFALMYQSYGDEIQKKVIKYHLDNGGISRFEKIKYFHQHFLNINLKNEEINNLANTFSDLVKINVIKSNYIPGALEFIKKNHKKTLQFICTGTPQIEIIEILKRRDIINYFNKVYGSPQKKESIIKEILDTTNLDTKNILYFGDAMTDYNAANEFNISFIGVLNNTSNFPPQTKVISDFENLQIDDFI